MSSEPITDSPDPRLQAALAEYLERIDRGEAVDREAFLAEFPDLAIELGELTADSLLHFEEIIVSPGIALATPALVAAVRGSVRRARISLRFSPGANDTGANARIDSVQCLRHRDGRC